MAAPVAEKPPSEELDEPAKPAKTGTKITGKPVAARTKDEDEDERPRREDKDRDENDDDRPRRKKGDDGDDARSRKRNDNDEDDEDRPKRRRRGGDDEDEGPPRGRRSKPQGGGSGAVLIILVAGFFGLTCCGGVGYGVYWAYNRAKETVEAGKEWLEKTNLRVNLSSYNGLRVGTNTRMEVDRTLGDGKVATADDLKLAFGTDQKKIDAWTPKVDQRRAIIWRNNDDYIVAAFHPGADATARLQAKEWRPKSAGYASEGELDDAKFLEKYPPGKKPGGDPGKPPTGTPGDKDDEPPPGTEFTEVKAEELAQAYKDNEDAADAKYKGKWLLVQGKVKQMQPGDGKKDYPGVQLDGVKRGKFDLLVWCFGTQDEASKVINLARGQTVTFQGKCAGNPAKTFVRLDHCRVKTAGDDPAIKVSAADLVREFADDSTAANEKYKDKEVLVTDAAVLVAPKGSSLITFRAEPKGPYTLQANFLFDQRDKLGKLKPGDKANFRARAGLLFGSGNNKYVSFYDAYFVP